MTTVAVFLSRGGLGDCAQHAVAHALSEENVTVRVIAREQTSINQVEDKPLLTAEQLADPRLEQLVMAYASDTPDATAALARALNGVDAVIAAPSSRQGKRERQAAASMTQICAAMARANVARLVYMSTIGVDHPPMPWSWVGKLFGLMRATNLRDARRDFTAADAVVRSNGLDYVIVRPQGLDPAAVPSHLEGSASSGAQRASELNISKAGAGNTCCKRRCIRRPKQVTCRSDGSLSQRESASEQAEPCVHQLSVVPLYRTCRSQNEALYTAMSRADPSAMM